jgi:hypothetical protein
MLWIIVLSAVTPVLTLAVPQFPGDPYARWLLTAAALHISIITGMHKFLRSRSISRLFDRANLSSTIHTAACSTIHVHLVLPKKTSSFSIFLRWASYESRSAMPRPTHTRDWRNCGKRRLASRTGAHHLKNLDGVDGPRSPS